MGLEVIRNSSGATLRQVNKEREQGTQLFYLIGICHREGRPWLFLSPVTVFIYTGTRYAHIQIYTLPVLFSAGSGVIYRKLEYSTRPSEQFVDRVSPSLVFNGGDNVF